MENTALAIQSAALSVRQQSGAGIVPAQVAHDLAERLKFMIVNGKKLSQDEVFALAQFSAANDLNPFAGESYYLPGTGPVPGIVGYERKAKEELEREATRHGINEVVYFDIEYVTPEISECGYEPGKDIAYKVILTDSLSSATWRKALNEMMGILREAGVTDYYREALAMVGKRPSWTGTGVVRLAENFGGDKMDRHERAKKRARKQAIKRRFPDLNLHEPENFNDAEPMISIEQPTAPRLSESEYLNKLGYGTEIVQSERIDHNPDNFMMGSDENDGDDIPDFGHKPEPTPLTAPITPPVNSAPAGRPLSAENLRSFMAQKVEKYISKNQTVDTDKQRQLLAMCLRQVFEGDDTRRKQCQLYLTGFASTKDMSGAHVKALIDWLNPTQDSGGAYVVNSDAAKEAYLVVTASAIEHGQQELF